LRKGKLTLETEGGGAKLEVDFEGAVLEMPDDEAFKAWLNAKSPIPTSELIGGAGRVIRIRL
jgi:hypothetical protein